MEIIRKGNNLNKLIRNFKCRECDCLFESKPDTTNIGQRGEIDYYCNCPECGGLGFCGKVINDEVLIYLLGKAKKQN